MPATLRALMLVLLCLAGVPAYAAREEVRLAPGMLLDEAGAATRRALNAWEQARRDGLPVTWRVVTLAVGENVKFGSETFLLLTADGAGEVRATVVGKSGPRSGIPLIGEEVELPPLKLMGLGQPDERGVMKILVRAAEPPPAIASSAERGGSFIDIEGFESPDRLVITAPEDEPVAFAAAFLRHMNAGDAPEAAAEKAREDVPPPIGTDTAAAYGDAAANQGSYVDSVNILQGRGGDEPVSALVTLRLVRAESGVLKQLQGGFAYDSSGRSPADARVSGSASGAGGAVELGAPGDRFRAGLRALEAEGEVNVESESFVRVALGAGASFRFNGPGGGVEGYIEVRPRGRGAVELDVATRSGDWSFLGGVSTRVRARHGQTVTLAQNSYQRTTSSSSGAPIVSGIPFVGPATGSSSSSKQSDSYALFATVELE